MRIVFMGTPDFAEISLKKIVEAGHEILAVISQPDRPKGRGMKFIPSPVKQYALEKGYDVYTPERIKADKQLIETIKKLKPDVICAVAFGQILSKEILDIPAKGCINLHGSLLPKYRGAAPIQWSIINGDETTGVSTMYMNEKMDEGDIILEKETPINSDETTGELFDRLAHIGADLLVETLQLVEENKAPRKKQGANYTIAPMISKEMANIDWEKLTAIQIKNLVRGLNPILGAKTEINNNIYKFWKVDVVSEQYMIDTFNINVDNFEAGEVIYQDSKHGLYIKTKEGIISVLEIQSLNSKRMNILEFLRGKKV